MIALHDLLRCDELPGAGRYAVTAPRCSIARRFARASPGSHRARANADAQRYALCIDDPFDFACALFALFACGKEPVIPANATAGYLADLSTRIDVVLTDADLPPCAHENAAEAAAAQRPRLTHRPHAPLTLYTSGRAAAPSRSARRSRNSTPKCTRSKSSGAR